MPCLLFPPILARLRGLCGRSRLEAMLQAQSRQLTRLEIKMADTNNQVLAKLEALAAQVAAWTTERGQELAAARKALADAEARGRAAQKEEDEKAAEADKQAALAKIDEISSGLISFSPSGN